MENIDKKADFLKNEYTKILSRIPLDAGQIWGKMNVQQMIEHMSEYVRIASGKMPMQTITPEDQVPSMQSFLATEKPFRENTPNSLMSETPMPVKHSDVNAAIKELQGEIDHFFEVHMIDPNKSTPNPFFGTLNFDQQIQLLHKHALHHLRQFGVNP
ncbi:MAG: hypothetical protein V4649_12890 [Bacteroidota bacterium]